MKITQKIFEDKLTFEEMWTAYKLTASGKGKKDEVMRFNEKCELYVLDLVDRIKENRYKPMPYKVVIIKKPKERKILAAAFIDRIVHRWVVDNFLLPAFEPTFINTSYACLKDKGMHKCCLDVFHSFRNLAREKDFYILKMDIAKYFKNIDIEILISILERKIESKQLMNLIKIILHSTPEEPGIAIGNYSSQTFANIYLNEADQYIKRQLHVKKYFRYMDDMVLFLNTKEEAIEMLDKIKVFLNEKLHLQLNSKTQIFKSNQGVNFCGYKINKDRMKIRTMGKTNLIRKQEDLINKLLSEEVNCDTKNKIEECYKLLNGHFGYIEYANCYNLLSKYFLIFD